MSQGWGQWDTNNAQQTTWNNQYGTPTLHSPAYSADINSRSTDVYYNQSQIIDVPTPVTTYNSIASAQNSGMNRTTSQQFKSNNISSNAGGVEGLDPSKWVNKDTATNCLLCEAPFSTLSKRKVITFTIHLAENKNLTKFNL